MKTEMVHYGLRRLLERAGSRVRESAASAAGGPREILRACLLGLLPVTEEGYRLSAVYTAYLSHAPADPEIRAPLRDVQVDLAAQLIPILRMATVPPWADAEQEVHALVSTAAGLASAVLIGVHSADEAVTPDRLPAGGSVRRVNKIEVWSRP